MSSEDIKHDVDRGQAKKMSLADMIQEQDEVKVASSSSSLFPWSEVAIKVAIIAGMLGLFYMDSLIMLGRIWWSNPDWSHGFVIPLFSIYMVYAWRDKIFSVTPKICYLGLGVMLLGIFMKAYGLVELKNLWIQQLSLPLLIWGIILYLCGFKIAMLLFVPVFFLELGMPLPENLYVKLSVPMQELAAKMSGGILKLFGVQMEVTNSFLKVVSINGVEHSLEVAEACSGMRSLMAFVALGVAMAFIDERPFWQRIVIMLAGIPIAVACNIIRVALTCTMFVIDQKEFGEGFMHNMMGMVLLIPALILLLLLAKVLDSMYEEVDDDEHEEDTAEETSGELPAGGEA